MFIIILTAGEKDANVSNYPVCANIQNILLKEKIIWRINLAVVKVATFLLAKSHIMQLTRDDSHGMEELSHNNMQITGLNKLS